MEINDILEHKNKDEQLIAQALEELQAMGYVIVGKQSYLHTSNGILCVHPINNDYIASVIVDKIKNKNLKEGI
tara:strand:+ start:2148 stop:2366 length:219 start_codon:yes stop_codon:yes gene_type:complete